MKIGELAQRTQVNIDTVRYYERQGLLPAPQRLASGYRLYDQRDVSRLRFVRRAKALGFTLVEIRELLDLSSHRDDDMAGMKAAHPGAFEYEVEAAIEYVYKKNGAFDWGYPSIVGSGPNATTLHYEKSTRQMQDGDLLLVEKPKAKGLVLPGMPLGSPGMEVPSGEVQPYTVELVRHDGTTVAYAEHGH